ncbi:MAG: DUF86 domain-containing protein [SAR324 cluster bacterium]|nr:DUF86 domain-containing protein [SAR324 cluster bacterium]
MSISILDLLLHILDELKFLLDEKNSLSEETFLKDERAKRAFARSFEIIGEASKNISDAFKEKHGEIEWKEMTRMRDRLIHHYFGVDYYIVWNTVEANVPKLKVQIESLIKGIKTE